jgi:hypothetical protein
MVTIKAEWLQLRLQLIREVSASQKGLLVGRLTVGPGGMPAEINLE